MWSLQHRTNRVTVQYKRHGLFMCWHIHRVLCVFVCVLSRLVLNSQSETGGILRCSSPVDPKTNESRWEWSTSWLWSDHFTHACTTLTKQCMHIHKHAYTSKHLPHMLYLPPLWNRSLWMGCTDTVDGVWILGSPLVASSITIFQRPAVLSYVHLSCSFSLLCMCSLTPLSVKSTVWLCLRQQLDGFKLLAWTFSCW